MQFDFLKRLFSGALHDKTALCPQSPPTPKSAPPKDAELTFQAKYLLIAAGALKLAARVQVRWNSRMRSTAGMAYPVRALITLNPRLREFPGETERTLRHELAHLLAQFRAGRRRIAPHGREWRKACKDLGIGGESRTHALPLPRSRRERRHIYRCPACAAVVTRAVPFKSPCACLKCCRAHNQGRYHARFRFEKIQPPPATAPTGHRP